MADHAYDPQADAFRRASESDWVDDAAIRDMIENGHLIDTTADEAVPVERYEEQNWDSGRHPMGPKSLSEAKKILRARVTDPRSPDWDSTVYDDLESR